MHAHTTDTHIAAVDKRQQLLQKHPLHHHLMRKHTSNRCGPKLTAGRCWQCGQKEPQDLATEVKSAGNLYKIQQTQTHCPALYLSSAPLLLMCWPPLLL
jgi:hypothetical protein